MELKRNTVRAATAAYTLTLVADRGIGSVSGGGTYEAGAVVSLSARPADGYAFARWGDGSISQDRVFVMPAQNIRLTAYWSDIVPFGRLDCSSITVAPFRKVCEHPDVVGTEPLILDVPVPSFVPPVPPTECACFDFTSEEKDTVVKACGENARCTVDIAQSEDDCCSGRYTITPHIEIPACSLEDLDPMAEGSFMTDGFGSSISWRVVRTCCDLSFEFEPHIVTPEIPMPCLPNVKGEERTEDETVTKFKFKVKVLDKDSETGTSEKNVEFKIKKETKSGGCVEYTFKNYPDVLDLTSAGGFLNGGAVFMDTGSSANAKNLFIDGEAYDDETTWYGGGYGDKTTDDPWAAESAGAAATAGGYCRGRYMRNTVGQSPVKWYDNIAIPSDVIENQQLVTPNASGQVARTTTKWTSSRKDEDDKGNVIKATEFTPGYEPGNLSTLIPSGFQWHDRGIAAIMSHFLFNSSGVLSLEEETRHAVLLAPAPAVTLEQAGGGVAPSGQSGGIAKDLNASGLAAYPAANMTAKITSGLSVKTGFGVRLYNIGDGATNLSDVYDSVERQGAVEVLYGPGFQIRGPNGSDGVPQYVDMPQDMEGALIPNDGRGLRVHGTTKMFLQYPNTSLPESTRPSFKNNLEIHCFSHDLWFQDDGRLVINDEKAADDRYMINDSSDGLNVFSRAEDMTFPTVVAETGYGGWIATTHGDMVDIGDSDGGMLADIEAAERYAAKAEDENVAEAFTYLCNAVRYVREWMATIFVSYVHVGKPGIVLGADGNYDCSSITRFAEQ